MSVQEDLVVHSKGRKKGIEAIKRKAVNEKWKGGERVKDCCWKWTPSLWPSEFIVRRIRTLESKEGNGWWFHIELLKMSKDTWNGDKWRKVFWIEVVQDCWLKPLVITVIKGRGKGMSVHKGENDGHCRRWIRICCKRSECWR